MASPVVGAPVQGVHQTGKGAPLCRREVASPNAGFGSVRHPRRIPCLSLAYSSRGWVAPNYGELDKEPPVTLKLMLAAQKDDQRSQDLRHKMDQNEHPRFPGSRMGSSCASPPWTVLFKCTSGSPCARTSSGWNTTSCAPVILGSTGCTGLSGANTTGSPWPRTCKTGWPAVPLVPGP